MDEWLREAGTRIGRRHLPAVLLVIALAGCEKASQPPAGDGDGVHTILVVGRRGDDPQWPGICGGAERFGVDVGMVDVRISLPDGSTWDAYRACVEQGVADGADAICLQVTPADLAEPDELSRVIDVVARLQLALVTMGQSANDPRVYGEVRVDRAAGAELLAQRLDEVAAGRQSYLLVADPDANPVANATYQRFAHVARRQVDLHLLRESKAGRQLGTPRDQIEELLALFPNAGLIVTLDPEPWITAPDGWLQKVRGLNSRFRFVTLSTVPDLWHHLGTAAAPGNAAALIGPIDGEIGYQACRLALRGLLTQRETSPIEWIPNELVTPTTLDDFAERYAKAANGLDLRRYRGGLLQPAPVAP